MIVAKHTVYILIATLPVQLANGSAVGGISVQLSSGGLPVGAPVLATAGQLAAAQAAGVPVTGSIALASSFSGIDDGVYSAVATLVDASENPISSDVNGVAIATVNVTGTVSDTPVAALAPGALQFAFV
jgi:hypothetical protein